MADLNKFFDTVDSLKPEFIQREYLPASLAAKNTPQHVWSGVMGGLIEWDLTTMVHTRTQAEDTDTG